MGVTLVTRHIEPDFPEIVLGVGLFAVAPSFLRAPEHRNAVQ